MTIPTGWKQLVERATQFLHKANALHEAAHRRMERHSFCHGHGPGHADWSIEFARQSRTLRMRLSKRCNERWHQRMLKVGRSSHSGNRGWNASFGQDGAQFFGRHKPATWPNGSFIYMPFFSARRTMCSNIVRQRMQGHHHQCPLGRFFNSSRDIVIRSQYNVRRSVHIQSHVLRAVANRSLHSLKSENTPLSYRALSFSALNMRQSFQGKLTESLYRGMPHRQLMRQFHTPPSQYFKSLFGNGGTKTFTLKFPKPSSFLAESWTKSPKSFRSRSTPNSAKGKALSTASSLDSTHFFEDPVVVDDADVKSETSSMRSFSSDASFLSDGRVGRGCYVEFDFTPDFTAPITGQLTDEVVDQIHSDAMNHAAKLSTLVADIKSLAKLGELPVTFQREAAMVLRVYFPNSDVDQVESLLKDVDITNAKIVSLDDSYDCPGSPQASTTSGSSRRATPESSASSTDSAYNVLSCVVVSGTESVSCGESLDMDTPSLTSANTQEDSEFMLA